MCLSILLLGRRPSIGLSLLGSPSLPSGSAWLLLSQDPRQKRLAEKQKQQENAQLGEVPEKLSFKEKMKMFAMETGEDGTPRDKVKISRAQREIDNITSPLNPTDNDKN
ncbi:hypothetical protein KQX54_003431 [Cotesia glomerata]|uniref:Uncharacterized protein n=1 Tax=Cotesia glomerata TaxID=32391 RepID=A0AAV7J3X0_COTGL|nr:hypothetical protein KQX54_003431 [Cotesia glomerata]